MKPLAVLVKIIPEQEDVLREVLEEVNDDLAENPYLRFPDSPNTHFARFVILDDPDNGPRLLLTTNFDGSYDDYLAELESVTHDPREIWGRCEGYAQSKDLPTYLAQHSERDRGVYVAFQDETVESIRAKTAILQEISDFLDHADVGRYLDHDRVARFLDLLSSLSPPRRPLWTRVGLRVSAGVDAVKQRFHDWFFGLLLDPPLELAKRFSNAAIDPQFSKVTVFTPEEVEATPSPVKHVAGQTSFTVYADVKPGMRWKLRLALAFPGTSLLSRYGYPPGNFANVYTLYGFRWLWVDNRKRIVFQSTFDGSWENYMADFINNLVWALNALYVSCEGYPAGGMADVYRFQRWIQQHQPVPQVVYNAYPDATILNIIKLRSVSQHLLAGYDRTSAEDWLRML